MSYYEVWQEGSRAQPEYRVVWAGSVVDRPARSKTDVARLIYDHCGGRWRNVMVVDRSDHGPPLDKLFAEIDG